MCAYAVCSLLLSAFEKKPYLQEEEREGGFPTDERDTLGWPKPLQRRPKRGSTYLLLFADISPRLFVCLAATHISLILL